MRTDWFTQARFGMFMHWGLYSLAARDEWIRSQDKLSEEEYQIYFDQFNPTEYNPKEWAKMAKQAGMKYVVLTAKHHDGFCLFDSKYTDYKATNTLAKRDLIKEYTDAVREEGLGVGIYFSLLDWHHKDYPKYHDIFHPMRGNEAYRDEKIDLENYINFMHHQIEEICTNYGKLDILWFDFSYGEMKGETWRAEELIQMVRKYQPDVIIDNRLEGGGSSYGSLMTDSPKPYAGDFVCPEHHIPVNGVRNAKGELIPWELCTTINNHWCYNPNDMLYKSEKLLIHKLVECVSKGGNMILNVGPMPTGTINEKSKDILSKVGEWLKVNGESIYECGSAELPKPDWGRYTKKGNVIYAHIFEEPIGPIDLIGIPPERIACVTKLIDRSVLKRKESFASRNNKEIAYISLGDNPNHTYPLPDTIDTVLKIDLKAE